GSRDRSPCLTALRATTLLPAGVFGPVDRRAFPRLASTCLSLPITSSRNRCVCFHPIVVETDPPASLTRGGRTCHAAGTSLRPPALRQRRPTAPTFGSQSPDQWGSGAESLAIQASFSCSPSLQHRRRPPTVSD